MNRVEAVWVKVYFRWVAVIFCFSTTISQQDDFLVIRFCYQENNLVKYGSYGNNIKMDISSECSILNLVFIDIFL